MKRGPVVVVASAVAALMLGLILYGEWSADRSTGEAGGGFGATPREQDPGSPEHEPVGDLRESALAPARQGWAAADPDAIGPDGIPRYSETVNDSVLVALSEELWSWQAGDEIVLTVPQIGARYVTTVDRVDTGLGNRSYVGRLMEGEMPYSFLITVGDRRALAYLGTPEGSYQLVGDTESAWLMPMANILDQYVDYSKPDFYIVERPERLIRVAPDRDH